MDQDTIELDGAHGEGGGQILRTALALAMHTGRPLRLVNIRARRPKPGLMRQHLACVRAAQAVSGATVAGDELGSQTLHFAPGPVRAGDYRFAIGSAGSCTLVLQTVLPVLLGADGPSTVHLSGGTHNPMAPTFHFLARCFVPLVRRCGGGLDLNLRRHGFYPAGGGEIEVSITPPAHGLVPFDLVDRGEALSTTGEVLTPGLPRGIAGRELRALGELLDWPPERLLVAPARHDEGPGNALFATLAFEAVTEVFTAFGERGRSSEQVAAGLAAEVRAYLATDAAAGPHLADQLALPLALAVAAAGQPARYTVSEVTEHTRTNCAVIGRFLPVEFDIAAEPRRHLVTVRRVA